MNCNATLTTLTPTDDVVATSVPWSRDLSVQVFIGIPDGQTVTRDGDRLLRVDATVLTCWGDCEGAHEAGTGPEWVGWYDDTPGATPHVGMSETNRHDPCPDCDGEGALPPFDVLTDCPSCSGSGTAPPFTDAEREAAMAALSRYQPDWNNRRIATEVLQAAAHARQEDNG